MQRVMKMGSLRFVCSAFLMLGLVVALPAQASEVDVDFLGDLSPGNLVWSDTFTWTSGLGTDFEVDLVSDVYFDGGSGIYTYVFDATVTATGSGSGEEVTGLRYGGEWDTADFPGSLDYGVIGSGTVDTYSFTPDNAFRAFFTGTDTLSDGESITLYAQSFKPPTIFLGDALDGGGPAPNGDNHGPVPEPATLSLLGLGLVGMAIRRKRITV